MSRRAPLAVVLLVAVFAVAASPAPAARVSPRPRVTISLASAVPVGTNLTVAGRMSRRLPGARVGLQQRVGKRWRNRAAARVRGRRFLLRWRVGGRPATIVARVVVRRGRRVVAASGTYAVSVLPRSAGRGARVPLVAGAITQAPAPGASGDIHAKGDVAAAAGDIVAAGASQATPDGYLGRVTKVVRQGDDTVIGVAPTTLMKAVPQGSFDVDLGSAPAKARAADAAAQAVDRTIACEAGASLSVTGSISVTPKIGLSAHWGGYSLRHPLGQLDSAALTASLTAAAKVEAKATGTAGCALDRTRIARTSLPNVTVMVLGLPVVLAPRIDWNVRASAKAQASLATDVHGSLTASAGVRYQHGSGFQPTGDVQSELGFTPPTASATAHAEAALEPVVSVLLYGLAGPSLNLSAGVSFDADADGNPWWKLQAPVKVTASLDVPDLDLHSGELTVYSRTFDLAHADGPLQKPSPPVAPPPVLPTAPTRQIAYWYQTEDLQCSLATMEDQHEWFFADEADDACGAFVAVDGEVFGPATIPAGEDLGPYTAFTPLSQERTGAGTVADPYVRVTAVAAGSTGVTLTEEDRWVDGGDRVESTFMVAGAAGDTRAVRLYQAADCFVADDDDGIGSREASTGTVGCVHDNGDGTFVTMTLTPLTPGASSTEKLFSDVWADIGAQGPFDDACTCTADHDNGFGLSWRLQLDGASPVSVRSRIVLGGYVG